jgi:hypothetical protein
MPAVRPLAPSPARHLRPVPRRRADARDPAPGSCHTARHGDPPPPRGSPAFVHRGEGMVTRQSSRKERSRGDGGEKQSSGEPDASRARPPGGVGRSGRRRSSMGVRAASSSMSPCRAAPRAARFRPGGGTLWRRCGPTSTRTEDLLRLLASSRPTVARPLSGQRRPPCSGYAGVRVVAWQGREEDWGRRGARLIRSPRRRRERQTSPRRRRERQTREAAAARHAASGRSCDVLWLLARRQVDCSVEGCWWQTRMEGVRQRLMASRVGSAT